MHRLGDYCASLLQQLRRPAFCPLVPYELFGEGLALTLFYVFHFTITLKGSMMWNTCTNISAEAYCTGNPPLMTS